MDCCSAMTGMGIRCAYWHGYLRVLAAFYLVDIRCRLEVLLKLGNRLKGKYQGYAENKVDDM